MKTIKKINVAILGVTGLVGRTIIDILKEREFPVDDLIPLASEKSQGKEIEFNGQMFKSQVPSEDVWKRVDVGLFSAGATLSKQWAPIAAKAGVVVVDNSSAFRMDDGVPLVVPEVNSHVMFDHNGKPLNIIANPNCSTIQLVVALKPLHDVFRIKRVVVSTYQSVTGKGKKGLEALESEMRGEKQTDFTHFKPIAYNVVPQVDSFLENGYTKEEMKMINETRKIMEEPNMGISPTAVRVPVYGGHSESVNVEFENDFEMEQVFQLLKDAPGVFLQDDPKTQTYPVPIDCYGKDSVFVGRLRRDLSIPKSLNMWIVSDNLRKGAATNAVQIAEKVIEKIAH